MKIQKNQYLAFGILLMLVPLGIYTKYYSGALEMFVNNKLGGVFYVIFFSLMVYLFFPYKKPLFICLLVLLVTTILEYTQLWHPVFLEKIRTTWIGASLIGNSFNLHDIPWYIVGAIIAFLIITQIKRFSAHD